MEAQYIVNDSRIGESTNSDAMLLSGSKTVGMHMSLPN